MSDASNEPRKMLEGAGPQPGETPEEWFRRTFGEMPRPVDAAAEPAGSNANDQRQAALSALERSIPDYYRWSRFSAPELHERTSAGALARAQQAWQDNRVCLVGISRAGKTSLAVAMLRRWVSHTNRPAVFIHAYRLSVARIMHPAGRGEPEIVEFAMRAPLVLIDDLGGERDHALSALPDILVERHAENRPTWVTTGMTRDQLVKRYGQGIVARVFERATVIPVGVEAG